jgi:hypothetical protein
LQHPGNGALFCQAEKYSPLSARPAPQGCGHAHVILEDSGGPFLARAVTSYREHFSPERGLTRAATLARDAWLGHDWKRTAKTNEAIDLEYLRVCTQSTESMIEKLQEHTTQPLFACKCVQRKS